MTLLYGTIGTNWITTSWIHAATKTGKWKLHAIYSRTQEQARSFGEKHGCSNNLYTSLEDFAKDSQMQVVYIASPNVLHYKHAKLMLKHRKHVILEKPATCTVRELEDLFHIAREEKVILIEAYRHIQEANFKLIKHLVIGEEKLGQIYGASFQYASYSSRYTNVLEGKQENIFSLELGGGALVDVGVYPITFAVALFGKPKSQTYVPFICSTGVDGGGVIILKYGAGFGVQINVSKVYTTSQPCEIYGEHGTLTVNATTDIDKVDIFNPRSKQTEQLAGSFKTVTKPDVNMEEEAAEFARIIEDNDAEEAAYLEVVSMTVQEITVDLRRQNGIIYPTDE